MILLTLFAKWKTCFLGKKLGNKITFQRFIWEILLKEEETTH